MPHARTPFRCIDLLIPFADHFVDCFSPPKAQGKPDTLTAQAPPPRLRQLGELLQGMRRVDTLTSGAEALTPPHERLLALSLGLADAHTPDGLVPWAALEASTQPPPNGPARPTGKAWAVVTPCHWAMGREHATLTDPDALALTTDETDSLRAAMQPYFATEGLTLHPTGQAHWLVEGELLRDLPTASLDRVLGRNVDAWLPATHTAPSLRRLHNEMQMLLYTHEINERRSLAGQMPVNSYWLSGSGALPAGAEAPLTPFTPAVPAPSPVARGLAQPAFSGDWPAYAAAWQDLDEGKIAALLARQNAGHTVRLALCGQAQAFVYESAAPSLGRRLKNLCVPLRAREVLAQLS